MRITPLAVLSVLIQNQAEADKLIALDTQFTHCNPVAIACVAAYSYLVKRLVILGVKDTLDCKQRAKLALDDLVGYIKTELAADSRTIDLVLTWTEEALSGVKEGIKPEEKQQKLFSQVRRQVGFMKHAYVLSVYFIGHMSEMDEEMLENKANDVYDDETGNRSLFGQIMGSCLSYGGDTDTNCAIVMGPVGALLGISRIPDHFKHKITNCDFKKGQNPRPDFLSTKKNFSVLLDKLCKLGAQM